MSGWTHGLEPEASALCVDCGDHRVREEMVQRHDDWRCIECDTALPQAHGRQCAPDAPHIGRERTVRVLLMRARREAALAVVAETLDRITRRTRIVRKVAHGRAGR